MYNVKNMRSIDSSGAVLDTLKMANLYVPNALPDRDEMSIDGVMYTKTANTAESTSFQVVTVDFENGIVYAHHWGAGIDIVMNYKPLLISAQAELITSLSDVSWNTNDDTVVSVNNGIVSPIASGCTTIWAKSDIDNCIEFWNVYVD
jgi:hypothetical protein